MEVALLKYNLKFIKAFAVLLSMLIGCQNYAQNLVLNVYEAETHQVMPFASIQIISAASDTIRITTNQDGIASQTLELGKYSIKVSSIGFKDVLLPQLVIKADQPLRQTIQMQYNGMVGYPVIIRPIGSPLLQITGKSTIDRAEALSLPAMFFDPGRVAATKPGMIQTNDGINGLSIHGLHPELVQWRVHGLEVVNPNHLPNAGTLTDRASQGAGGAFIISSQALGASQLYTGAMPMGVGDAVAGVLDLQLRQGDTKTKRTLQVGLIGLDAAIEGPIGRGSRASYLFNYRYSTVGLLSKLGVSFGGEKIAFQDLNANLVFPTQRGNIKVFALLGQSTNVFKGDTSVEVKRAKDFTNIDFESRTGIVGIHALNRLKQNLSLEYGTALSQQKNTRQEEQLYAQIPNQIIDNQEHSRLSSKLILRKEGKMKSILSQYTLGLMHSFKRLRQISPTSITSNLHTFTLQPFAEFSLSKSLELKSMKQIGLTIGLQSLYDQRSAEFVPQPRIQLALWPRRGSFQLKAASGLHAQLPLLSTINQALDVQAYSPMRAWYHQIGLERQQNQGLLHTVSAAVFYQLLQNLPFGGDARAATVFEGQYLETITGKGHGRSVGLESSAKIARNEKYAFSTNLTVFHTDLTSPDGSKYQTRYNVGYIANILADKTWKKQKSASLRTYTLATRFILTGGQRATPIALPESINSGSTIYDQRLYGTEQYKPYYRIDLRFQRTRAKVSGRLYHFAIELQNLTGNQNDDYQYFDPLTKEIVAKKQLGLIPNLNWRVEW
jgi:hypothetical protein